MEHYVHLSLSITRFFKSKGMEIAFEAHGSRGADLVGINGTIMVGEIKHAIELGRDLHCTYWSSWNSVNQIFGGKKLGFQLRCLLPNTVDSLSGRVKGWIATIYGQLKYWTESAGLTQGWIVYESYDVYEESLLEALDFLRSHNLIEYLKPEHLECLGFIKIEFK